jgi:hypothetical protein
VTQDAWWRCGPVGPHLIRATSAKADVTRQVVYVVVVDPPHHHKALVGQALEDGVGKPHGHSQGVGDGALGEAGSGGVCAARRVTVVGGGRVDDGKDVQLPLVHGGVGLRFCVCVDGVCGVEHCVVGPGGGAQRGYWQAGR